MGRHETIVPLDPPAADAQQAVLGRLKACKAALAVYKGRIAELALGAAFGKPGAVESLAALGENIRATEFEIESHPKARELAARRDDEAVMLWKTAVQTLDPEELVAGITRDQCCRRCGTGTGCVITAADATAGACAHPVLVGPLELLCHEQNPKIQAVYAAACAKTGVVGRNRNDRY